MQLHSTKKTKTHSSSVIVWAGSYCQWWLRIQITLKIIHWSRMLNVSVVDQLFKILIYVTRFLSFSSSIIMLTFEAKNVTRDYITTVAQLTIWLCASSSVYYNMEQSCLKMAWKRCKPLWSICRLKNLYQGTKLKVLLNWMVSKCELYMCRESAPKCCCKRFVD